MLSLRSLVDYAYFTVLKSEYQEGRLIATEKKFDVGGLGNRRCMRIATRTCQKITLINRDTGSDSGDAKRQTGKTTPTESVFAIN